MFQEIEDISALIAPIAPEASGLEESGQTASELAIEELFEELKLFLMARANENSAFRNFLQENDIMDIGDYDFEVFKEKYVTCEDDMSSKNPSDIYISAFVLFELGEIKKAISLFSLIAAPAQGRKIGLMALAACAYKLAYYQRGYDLAEECILHDDKHPRSHLIAGYCALKLKNFNAAKRYLALTTRLARKKTEFRAEQRSAQRELLLLQFSG